MKHLGDITKISGYDVEPTWVVCGGSPCQDLSVAGKRAGLAGARSGLFMEQIRIIKEMREKDEANGRTDKFIRPRYMVWENVPGAFSSNGGKDFQAVLEETARVKDKDAVVPMPDGKWTPAGCIMGNGWSIAWRVHDAQFWGVPQRRKRISLIADFGGETAPEILFERKSVSRDFEQSGKEGETAATDTESGVGTTSVTLKVRGGAEYDRYGHKAGKGALIQKELSGTLGVSQDQTLITGKCLNGWDVQSKHIQPEEGKAEALYSGECRGGGGESYVMQKCYGISSYDSNAMKSPNPNSGVYETESSRTLDLNGGNPACNQGGVAVVQTYQKTTGSLCASGYDKLGTQEAMNDMYVVQTAWDGSQVSPTLTANNADGSQRMPDKENFNGIISMGVDAYNQTESEEKTKALSSAATDSDHVPCVYGIDRASFNQGMNAKFNFSIEKEKAPTLVAKGPGGVLSKKYVNEGKCIIQFDNGNDT